MASLLVESNRYEMWNCSFVTIDPVDPIDSKWLSRISEWRQSMTIEIKNSVCLWCFCELILRHKKCQFRNEIGEWVDDRAAYARRTGFYFYFAYYYYYASVTSKQRTRVPQRIQNAMMLRIVESYWPCVRLAIKCQAIDVAKREQKKKANNERRLKRSSSTTVRSVDKLYRRYDRNITNCRENGWQKGEQKFMT